MLILPTVNVQPDLPAVVSDVHGAAIPQESVWVSCYARDSVHAKLNVVLDERNRDQINFVSDDNLKLARIHETVCQLPSLSARTHYLTGILCFMHVPRHLAHNSPHTRQAVL